MTVITTIVPHQGQFAVRFNMHMKTMELSTGARPRNTYRSAVSLLYLRPSQSPSIAKGNTPHDQSLHGHQLKTTPHLGRESLLRSARGNILQDHLQPGNLSTTTSESRKHHGANQPILKSRHTSISHNA